MTDFPPSYHDSRPEAVSVALARCRSYDAPSLPDTVKQVLDAAQLVLHPGMKVLVKPNLLINRPLACTSPQVVAAACSWLLDHGIRPMVADSPGFGRAAPIAEKVGVAAALAPLGLAVEQLDDPVSVAVPLNADDPQVRLPISRKALECDLILSLPRFKAHSQMRLTLAVKNCFGCVCGLRKAFVHAVQGEDPALFARCQAGLWAALPPMAGLVDGITAMHVTGPSRGQPFALGLLGASASAVALDEALHAVLGLAPEGTPLGAALAARKAHGSASAGHEHIFPLLRPHDFAATGFELPQQLAHTSFRPMRLVQSCFRRIWAIVKP